MGLALRFSLESKYTLDYELLAQLNGLGLIRVRVRVRAGVRAGVRVRVRVRIRVRVRVRVRVDEELRLPRRLLGLLLGEVRGHQAELAELEPAVAVGVVLVEGGEGGVDGALGETEGAQADAHLGGVREM